MQLVIVVENTGIEIGGKYECSAYECCCYEIHKIVEVHDGKSVENIEGTTLVRDRKSQSKGL